MYHTYHICNWPNLDIKNINFRPLRYFETGPLGFVDLAGIQYELSEDGDAMLRLLGYYEEIESTHGNNFFVRIPY